MIKVNRKQVHFTESEDTLGIQEIVINAAIDSVVEVFKAEANNLICEKHPNSETHVLVSGNYKQPFIEISKCCCEEFADILESKLI